MMLIEKNCYSAHEKVFVFPPFMHSLENLTAMTQRPVTRDWTHRNPYCLFQPSEALLHWNRVLDHAECLFYGGKPARRWATNDMDQRDRFLSLLLDSDITEEMFGVMMSHRETWQEALDSVMATFREPAPSG
jgi:hypothetical protein